MAPLARFVFFRSFSCARILFWKLLNPPPCPPPPSPKENNNCPPFREFRYYIVIFAIFYSTMALCNVLQFFVNTGDKRLSSIIVKGERIFQQDEGKKQLQTNKLHLKLFSMLRMLALIIFRETKQPIMKP